jgi:hypothetical protein
LITKLLADKEIEISEAFAKYVALANKGLPAPSIGTQEKVSAIEGLYVGGTVGVAVKRGVAIYYIYAVGGAAGVVPPAGAPVSGGVPRKSFKLLPKFNKYNIW